MAPVAAPLRQSFRHFRRAPLAALERMASQGSMVPFYLGRQPYWLCSEPELIQDMLIRHSADLIKENVFWASRGPVRPLQDPPGVPPGPDGRNRHLEVRRQLQPLFQRSSLAGYREKVRELCQERTADWPQAGPIDLHGQMALLTTAVISSLMFEHPSPTEEMAEAVLGVTAGASPIESRLGQMRLDRVPEWRRRRRAMGRLELLVGELLDTETGEADTVATRLQVHEDLEERERLQAAVTVFLAGVDTTASALSWALLLAAQNKERQERLCSDPLYVDAFVLETLRLYPSSWYIARRARQPLQIGEARLALGDTVVTSPYLVQRDERFWPDGNRFHPERWLEADVERPRFAYFPFGGGQRQCLGEHLAKLEMSVALPVWCALFSFQPALLPSPVATATLTVPTGTTLDVYRR